MEGYVPEPYQGRIVLLRTDSMQSVAPCDPTAGWGRVAKEVEVLSMPGTHDACVTENLGILAEHLAACLRKASQPVAAHGNSSQPTPALTRLWLQ